jgi:signal-transduction protein with cAMP-binding, CBS, and nucleotidyltransferase domain
VVDEQGRMVGICTRTDFYRAVQELRPGETPLAEIMRKSVLTVRASDSLTTALLVFLREPVKRVVVVADEAPDRPVGMLTPFDVLRARTDALLGDGQA